MPVHRGNGAVGQLLVHSLVKEQGLVEIQVIEGSIPTTTAEEEGWNVVDNCILVKSPQVLQLILFKHQSLVYFLGKAPKTIIKF